MPSDGTSAVWGEWIGYLGFAGNYAWAWSVFPLVGLLDILGASTEYSVRSTDYGLLGAETEGRDWFISMCVFTGTPSE